MQDKLCVFCRDDFPLGYQIISDKPKYWYFVHNIRPICDFHCLLVLKNGIFTDKGIHINDMSEDILPQDALIELGILLNKACISIKKCSNNIKNVNIISLNSGVDSKHLHFHLIPIYKNDQIKKVNNLDIDGGGFTFLSRKEIVDDTIDDYIKATCGENAKKIILTIENATKKRIKENVKLLKNYFI